MGALALVTQMPGRPSRSNDDVWELWVSEMRAAGCSERTIRARWFTYGHFARSIDVFVIDAKREHLMPWLGRPGLSGKTRQNHKSFLHTLYSILQDAEWRLDNPAVRLPRSKVPRTEANPFSTEELERLLAVPKYRKTQMMILLAAYQGFRATEIAAVSDASIDWERMRIRSVEAKGGVEVWRPLHPVVAEAAREFPREGWWFPGTKSRAGTHVKANSVSNVVGAAMRRAGVRNHRPHQLRAWFATELVASGADMLTVQHAMRHSSPATLRYYVPPSQVLMSDAMGRLPVAAGSDRTPKRGGVV